MKLKPSGLILILEIQWDIEYFSYAKINQHTPKQNDDLTTQRGVKISISHRGVLL